MNSATVAALVVYLPIDGVDVTAGAELLTQAGFEVRHVNLEHLLTEPSLKYSVALLVGYDRIGPDVMDALPNLKVIATHSAGVDMVDLNAADERGIVVHNVPDAATEDVAVHALALSLSLLRGLPAFDRQVRDGGWKDEPARVPRRASTLTYGIVGLGRIGRYLAGLVQPMFAEVIGYDPALPPEAWPEGVRCVSLRELLEQADIISLHVPLTPETYHLIGAAELTIVKPGAVIVNTSRADLIDHQALTEALDSGRIDGAGLDVLAVEPPAPNEPLLRHPNVTLSPHVAYLSQTSQRGYATVPASIVREALSPPEETTMQENH